MADDLPLHDTLAAVVANVRATMLPHEHDLTERRRDDWYDRIEAAVTALTGPVLEPIVNHPDIADTVKALIGVGIAPEQANELTVILMIAAVLLFPLVGAAVAPGAQAVANVSWAIPGNDVTPLSPAEIALGMVRNTLGGLDAYGEAAKAGLSPHKLDILELNTGEPISIQEALLLFRRGLLPLDSADANHPSLHQAVLQSRVRDSWFGAIQDLKYSPPPAGEVVAGRLKAHLTDTEYRTKLSEAGIDPVNADWMLRSAGRPYGIEQALELWNRNTAAAGTGIDETRVRAVIAQSDVNPDFTDDILKLRWYIPPVRSIMPMLRSGAIDDAKATQLFTEQGVRPADIPGYLAEAHHGRTATVRALTEAQVVRMYSAQLIDRPTAQSRLEALRITPADAGLLLDYADNLRHEKYVEAIVNRVHARYVAWKLTDAEATAALGADGIPANASSDYLRLWRIERDANVHVLTPAAIVGAYRRKQIGPAECKARLFAVGVQQADLAIVVADAYPPTKPAPTEVAAVVNA